MARSVQTLTCVVKEHCDTFYSAPGFDSLYIYTGLPAPTGLLSNWPGVLTDTEQREIVGALQDAERRGEHVCVVRDVTLMRQWRASTYGTGPLGIALRTYTTRVGGAGYYTVSIKNDPRTPSAGGG